MTKLAFFFHFSLAVLLALPLSAAEAPKKSFDLPAGDAADTLQRFVEQADQQIVYLPNAVRGIKTNSVTGEFTARAALMQMLQGTPLTVVEDKGSGALMVQRPIPADAPAGLSNRRGDEPVKLNPFEVQADSDKSYGALNSNSITSFRTDLEKLPISADIFDQTFMNDIGEIGSVEQMIQTYSAGAGVDATNPGQTAALMNPGDRNGSTGLRGLSTGTIRRDTFMSVQPTGSGVSSPFDIDRVEIINGPQSLLFGSGGAGGVINLISKQARLGQRAFGSLEYQVDQYGHKLGQFDFGVGTSKLAVRYAMISQDWGTRLQWAGGPLHGYYLQLAAKVFGNTVIRATAEDTSFRRIANIVTSVGITGPSTANDARSGLKVNYLLATNQIQQSANGAPSGMGVIDNGFLNYNNDHTPHGWWGTENSFNHWGTIAAQTQWTTWLSTDIDAGFNIDYVPRSAESLTVIDAPTVPANPTGTWAIPDTGTTPAQDTIVNSRRKSARFSALLTNDLFGIAKSKTIIGTDFTRFSSSTIGYGYFQADSNWNVVIGSTGTLNGRIQIPGIWIPVGQGPVKYPYWAPFSDRVVYNGVNYIRQIKNTINPNLISPANPLGVTGIGGTNYSLLKTIDKGLFAVNDSEWFGGRIETLLGVRITKDFTAVEDMGAPPQNVYVTRTTATSYNAGLNYRLLSWLRPYASFSDSYNPPTSVKGDPFGNSLGSSKGLGEEIGLKITSPNGGFSGSLAIYAVQSKNESVSMTATLFNDINPSGLNGRYGANPSIFYNIDRKSQGVQLGLTASPTSNWRMRLSAAYVDGTVGTAVSYKAVYNDQFHENSAGQVTYADGTVVYVPATFNSKQLTVSSTTAGAMPLTVALMNSSSSPYYANPLAVTGQIRATSNAGVVLLNGADPVHGPILTGVTGLPTSQIQINPGFTVPSVIPVSAAGDKTVGYPEFSLNLTNLYTFSEGWMNGIKIGGTIGLTSRIRRYNYYPQGVSLGATDVLYTMPNRDRVDLIVGYERKFKRLTWSTQMNVSNLFNRYHVVILPDPVNGYAGVDDATFDQEPRMYSWTNRISF